MNMMRIYDCAGLQDRDFQLTSYNLSTFLVLCSNTPKYLSNTTLYFLLDFFILSISPKKPCLYYLHSFIPIKYFVQTHIEYLQSLLEKFEAGRLRSLHWAARLFRRHWDASAFNRSISTETFFFYKYWTHNFSFTLTLTSLHFQNSTTMKM